MLRETLRDKLFAHKPAEIFKAAITGLERDSLIIVEHDSIRSASHSQKFTDEESRVIAALREIFLKAELEVPKLDEAIERAIIGTKFKKDQARKLVQVLINGGEVIKVTNEFYFASTAIARLTAKLRAYADASTDRLIDVAKFKDIAGVSRRYAIPLLEYFDRAKVTVRSGDRRVVL
jgi:selenocysteine-specific elongation factor